MTHLDASAPRDLDVAPIGPDVRRRLRDRLRSELARDDPTLDGILLLAHANVVWASGFDHSPSERPVGYYLPTAGTPTLYVPFLEAEHAESVDDVHVETYPEFPGEEHPALWIQRRIAARADRPRRWAVDRLDGRLWRRAVADGHDLAFSDAAERTRGVKEPEELRLVRAAARYADVCLAWILDHGGAVVADGGSELDLLRGGVDAARAALEHELGARFPASQLHVVGTVHSGPRAALPHGRTGPRVPGSAEPVIAGIGAKVGGYHAESGATFVVDGLDEDTARCLAAADACRLAAVHAARPGATCVAVHEAAMAALADAGLEEHTRHRIGHGMGVEGHEAPWLAPGDATVLRPGMVFSNEPGIYRPGIDGYRTIESMIVRDDGAELASRFQSTVPWDQRVLRTS